MSGPLPLDVRTLSGMFDVAAQRHPTRTVRTFFAEDSITFGELARTGRILAGNLVAAGVAPGTPVAVLIRSVLELLPAMSGISAAGGVLVPLPVPVGGGKAHPARLRQVIQDSGVRYAVVDDTFVEHFADALPDITTMTFSELVRGVDRGTLPAVDAADLALIQYTSGSTSAPRGVALTHRNVLAGIRALHHGTGVSSADILCHWLPLSHDMGLFSTLAAVGAGLDVNISSPWDFVKHPEAWLRTFCDLGATILVGPNFSYRYLVDTIPREDTADYDLAAVRVLLNGAEPIDPALATEFEEHFAASNLSPRAMTSCYGLAEATLAVTIAPTGSRVAVDWVDREALNGVGRAWAVDPDAPGARGVVNCGTPVPGIEVRIAEDGRELDERVVGDIEIRGEPVMGGYYREPTPSVRADGWCPTGDVGYLVGSCLHVTGRRKEMLILGGRNHYPQDVEEAVRRLPEVYKEYAVAVVLPADPAGRPERIGVLAGVTDPRPPFGPTVSAIRDAAAEELGGASVDVVLLRKTALLRTTSGKFQRLLMRRQLLAGALQGVLVHVAADEHPSQVDASAPCPA